MPTLPELAEAVQRAQERCAVLENRERQLGSLVDTGRWESLYDEKTFRGMCDSLQSELKAERLNLTRAEDAFASGVFSTARTAHEGRELASAAMNEARQAMKKRDAELLMAPQNEIADRARDHRVRDGFGRERSHADENIADWTRSTQ